MEICVGLGLGIIGSVGLRGAMQKDLDAFQPKKAGGSAKAAKTMSADEKADVANLMPRVLTRAAAVAAIVHAALWLADDPFTVFTTQMLARVGLHTDPAA